MKNFFPLTFIFILFLSACSSSPQDKLVTKTDVVTPMHNYRCESGKTIAVAYPSNNSAIVHYKDNIFNMQIAISASGARYVGGEFEWWTKGSGAGSEGTLYNHMADGTTGKNIESCIEY